MAFRRRLDFWRMGSSRSSSIPIVISARSRARTTSVPATRLVVAIDGDPDAISDRRWIVRDEHRRPFKHGAKCVGSNCIRLVGAVRELHKQPAAWSLHES